MKHMVIVAALAVALWGAFTESAHAYLDPGTGSILLQMLIGGIAGGLIVLKMYWTKAKLMIFGRNKALDSKDH